MAPSARVAPPSHAFGRAQYRGLRVLMGRLAGTRDHPVTLGGTRVPLLLRDGTDATRAPALLLHGFGGDKEGWLGMAAWMRRTRALVIPDLPGFGAAGEIPADRASAKAQADALIDLLDQRGIRRAHLIGNSMGGGIALRVAADFPARVASMTLLGSVGPFPVKSEVGYAFDRGENPLLTSSEDDFDRLMALVAVRPPPMPRAMRRYLGARLFARRDAYADLFRGWTHPANSAVTGVPSDLATILAPVLVMHGECDRVIDSATGRALAAGLPNARLALLPNIGHIPHLEAPRDTARRTDAFLDSLESL